MQSYSPNMLDGSSSVAAPHLNGYLEAFSDNSGRVPAQDDDLAPQSVATAFTQPQLDPAGFEVSLVPIQAVPALVTYHTWSQKQLATY